MRRVSFLVDRIAMFQTVSLDEAATRRWDVIVAGTSFAAMFFARALPRDLSVLFVEKGALQEHADQLEQGISGRETVAQENASGHPKRWVAHTKFGGNSNCWWAQTPRFHPNDFRLRSLYGIGEDWPLSYDDLEGDYLEVERVMQITGGSTDHLIPRSAPYPFPPHPGSLSDQRLRQERPDIWVPVATARSNGGDRAICCNNGVCHLCPVDSKFTVLNGIAHFVREGAALLGETELRAIRVEGGTARGALLRGSDGREAEVGADLVALGANALFNSAIMMRSGLGAEALGRYIHEQTSRHVTLDVPVPGFFGGTSIPGHCYGFYDGAHRRTRAACLIENFNILEQVRPERGKWTHRLNLKVIAEDLPLAENRIVLDESDEPRILWQGHSDYGAAGRDWAAEHVGEVLPFPVEAMEVDEVSGTEAHIQGTHRMGTDPATSVVDDRLRCHGVSNLLALGAGAFPSCAPANPTLTLSALSHRAGRLLS